MSVDAGVFVMTAGVRDVSFFRRPAGGDFTNGMAAEKVVGQPDFFTITRATATNRMYTVPTPRPRSR